MRNNVWRFLAAIVIFSAAGAVLRAIELRTALDTSTMLMDFVPASLALLILSAILIGVMALISSRSIGREIPGNYVQCFGEKWMLPVSVIALLMMFTGALLCLRDRNASLSGGIASSILALLGALAGAAWLSLGIEIFRKKGRGDFLSSVLPVLFCGAFLIIFYKSHAQQPAMLLTLYPFLALCASLAALHLISGFTVNRVRPRPALFLAGTGCYLCIVSMIAVTELSLRLFFGAIALELAAHGTALLIPHSIPAEAQPGPDNAGCQSIQSESADSDTSEPVSQADIQQVHDKAEM